MRDPAAVVKAYDIRGVVDDELDEGLAQTFGACFARLVPEPEVVVGHDMRASSPRLARAFIRGVRGQGSDVVRIGLASTDMVSYASAALARPGAMITASHNPPHYNGIKLCRAHAEPIGWDTGLSTLLRMARTATPGPGPTVRAGDVRDHPVLLGYRDHLLALAVPDAAPRRRVTAVVEAGGGMAGLTVPAVLGALPVEVIGLNFAVDGNVPQPDSDPMKPGYTVELRARVREMGADVGFAFDGDADRCVVVDERGETVPPSAVGALLAERALAREPGAAVVHSAVTSQSLVEAVNALGGRTTRSRVGHSYMKREMARHRAVLGVEHSGHYYFRDFWNADSGLLAALHVLAASVATAVPVSELIRRRTRYTTLPETAVRVGDPEERLHEVARVAGARADTTCDWLDGLTARRGDGAWFNLRPSQTESRGLLRLNVEALDAQTARCLRAEVLALLEEAAPSRPSVPPHAPVPAAPAH
ncbi:Phosphomannomutase [Streptomyces formicae]|uniref:Phosphomannomutase n=2 Tax=Streptomyces formicae TaxID=1616117 RepID=A0A291Q0B2_9ACTN|nr:Phosphomannomutase [Streptomyces formicae]ATL33168.1 Phosphomannomutase [Streptomyces formicae]